MTQQEKLAWFNLLVLAVTGLAYWVLMPLIGPKAACAAFGLLGFWGIGPLFLRQKSGNRRVIFDERDQLIQMRASTAAYSIFWVLFVGVCMSIYWKNLVIGTVPVTLLPSLPLGGFIVITLVQSLAVLIQYRQGR